jgi:type II secretory pathway pseudopilin PulG
MTGLRSAFCVLRFRGAFTLVESMVASLVLAIAVVGIAGTLASSQQQTAALEENATAIALGQQLIEEIAAKPLVVTNATPGWPTQTSRANYESINDYNGYTDTNAMSLIGGASSGAGGGFTRTVTLTYPASLFGTTVTAGDWVIVSVTVRDNSGRSVTLNRLVARATMTR